MKLAFLLLVLVLPVTAGDIPRFYTGSEESQMKRRCAARGCYSVLATKNFADRMLEFLCHRPQR